MDKAVILAAGAGKRMRQAAPSAALSPEQAELAARGIKALIPIGRPFLDYVLARVAEAGYRRVCLVIGPAHDELRTYYGRLASRRLSITFAVQEEPLGTAHAVAAAAAFIGDDYFLVINSDNCYPVPVLRELRGAEGSAVAGFERRGLVSGGNIPDERVARFAVLEVGDDGYLRGVLEKPEPAVLDRLPDPILVSMNCWRFGPSILTACRKIARSTRGEYEIPDAVTYAIEKLEERLRVFPSSDAVLDLSSREDIATLWPHLEHLHVDL